VITSIRRPSASAVTYGIFGVVSTSPSLCVRVEREKNRTVASVEARARVSPPSRNWTVVAMPSGEDRTYGYGRESG
jgi:hypothetical protein